MDRRYNIGGMVQIVYTKGAEKRQKKYSQTYAWCGG